MRSNLNYLDVTDPNQLKNYQKLDYDLWHHATLASYFKALNSHSTKLSITIVRLCDRNFNVDSRSFERLIDLLDNLPVQLKRTMSDQLNFQLSSLDGETLKLSFTSSFGYYLQTLVTLAPEDEVKQNIDTLLKLRTNIAELPTSQANDQAAENSETDNSQAPFSHRVNDNPDIIRYENQDDVASQGSNALQDQTIATQSSEGSSNNAQNSNTVSKETSDTLQQSEGTATSPVGITNTQTEFTDTTATNATETPPLPDSVANAAEAPASPNNAAETPASSDNAANTAEAPASPDNATETNPLTSEPINGTDTTPESDDDDDEFSHMYDDDDDNDNTTGTMAANTNNDTNKAAIDAIQNNSAGEILDDSPVDYNETVDKITNMFDAAMSSDSEKAPKTNPLDEFYRKQDQTLANKLTTMD